MIAVSWTSVCTEINLRVINLYPIISFFNLCQLIPTHWLEISLSDFKSIVSIFPFLCVVLSQPQGESGASSVRIGKFLRGGPESQLPACSGSGRMMFLVVIKLRWHIQLYSQEFNHFIMYPNYLQGWIFFFFSRNWWLQVKSLSLAQKSLWSTLDCFPDLLCLFGNIVTSAFHISIFILRKK